MDSLANLEMVFFLIKVIELHIRNISQFSNIIYIFTIYDSNFIKIYLKLLKIYDSNFIKIYLKLLKSKKCNFISILYLYFT